MRTRISSPPGPTASGKPCRSTSSSSIPSSSGARCASRSRSSMRTSSRFTFCPPPELEKKVAMERFKYSDAREAESAARVRALEALLIEKGVIGRDTVDKVLEFFETQMGPFNGAKIVARAWVDDAFKKRLVADTPSAIAELDFPPGMAGAEGEHLRIAENTPSVHNLIVCTLCSCYPWPTLGLPPYWFKDPT